MSAKIKIEPREDDITTETDSQDDQNCISIKKEFVVDPEVSPPILQQNIVKEEVIIPECVSIKVEIEEINTNSDDEESNSQMKSLSNNEVIIPISKIKESPVISFSDTNELDITVYKTENNAYKCPVCSKLLYFKSHFERHLEMHNRPTFECNVCHQRFKKEKNYKKHVENHKDRKYKCNQCENSYKNQSKLTQHKKIHDTDNPLKCKICNKLFINKLCMTRHKQICPRLTTCEHADVTNNILQCEQCRKKNKVKWVYCRFCKKRFDDLQSLRPHMKEHRGEKPYSCKICQRQFSTKSNMQRHRELHEKPKKLTCPICGRWFPLESKVIYHMGTHAKIQPFHCKICPKKFSHKINATRHYQEKHPNEKFDTDVSYGSFAKAVVKEMKLHNIVPIGTKDNSKKDQIEERSIGKFEEVFVKTEPIDYEE